MIAVCLGGCTPEVVGLHHRTVELANGGITAGFVGIAFLGHGLTHDFPSVVVEKNHNTIDGVFYQIKCLVKTDFLVVVVGVLVFLRVAFRRIAWGDRTSILPGLETIHRMGTHIFGREKTI